MDRRAFLTTTGAAGSLAMLGHHPAAAADLAGKTVTFIIPFGVGGGSDVWGRFIAQFLTRHIKGNPSIVVKNQPGGGSVGGANFFAATAKPDGLTILGTSGSTQFPYLLGEPRVKYEYRDWRLILAGPTGGVAYISAKTGVKGLKDIANVKQKLHYASQGVTSLDLVPLLAFRMLGLDVQHVTGFPGRGEGRLAFERGEASIDYQTTSAYLRSSMPLVKRGEAVPLFSWGALDTAGNLARDPNFPELPHFGEAYQVVQGKKPDGIEWDAMRAFLIAGFMAQKLLLLPKGTPDDIVETYRAGVRAMTKDPEYLAKRDAAIGEYEQVTDAAGEKLYQSGITISPDARKWVREFLAQNYKVTFDSKG